MVLKPLEFSDCLADSPWFRQNLHSHENALEETSKKIKTIEQQCRKIISYNSKLSQAQRAFASSISEFKIETVGSTQTDDERIIANSLKEFAALVRQIEEQRAKIIEEAERLYLDPLQNLVERINRVVRDDKHKYVKESNRFYTGLEKHLHLSTVRKNDFREADAQLGLQQRTFCQASMQYVSEILTVHERVKFEFVETLSSFIFGWLSFYHIGNVIHEDFREVYNGINSKVQKAKESFEATQAETEELKRKMLITHMRNAVFPSGSTPNNSLPDIPLRPSNSNIKQGYCYIQEKSIIPSIGRDVKISLSRNWTKYYCVYSKETRIFTMIPVTQHSSKAGMKEKGFESVSVSFKLKSCVRRASDSIDKRFCFDVIPEERSEVITIQALSEEDRRQWLEAMDGREPVYSPGAGATSTGSFDS
ncbi:BAR domain of APPL family domain-containing protein [Ditylenchus destructor]|uniref:BAR domain of APPL family domain-containing protein n=1 Tax=Ditylenchus destructor TaxID=166010 RepID=A0AAD4RB36_9BILA|nr:BAR domain of APPL family domain-containing protein [Ditylenchus destructor]